jgi:hypothetical protein
MGIHVLKHCIRCNKHTNVFVLNTRHDLIPNSCVNNVIRSFNKTFVKLKKVFPNLFVITVDTDRDLYTIHGYVNVVPLTYVILISLLSFDMSDWTLAAMDEINK